MTPRPQAAGLDRAKLRQIRQREHAVFVARTGRSAALHERARQHMPNAVPMGWMSGLYRSPPIFAARGAGSRFWDIDGNEYLDFNVCDLSMTMGFAPPAIVRAVSDAVARGAHFLLPTEDSVWVAEDLAQRTGLPHWQFTLSATGANAEVMRIARVVTGRSKIVLFDGQYHGHLEETLVHRGADGSIGPELLGTSAAAAANTELLHFNDIESLDRCLRRRDVALVLTEPALTNCTLVRPTQDFLPAVQELTRRYGSLLCYDEAHTFQFAYGGLVREWKLQGDFAVLGKGLGTGISFALYGMTERIAEIFARLADIDIGPRGIATGGTTYGSTVAVAAARAALDSVLTPDAYVNLVLLGERLAVGLEDSFLELGLSWRAHHLGPRSGYCLFPSLPLNGAQAAQSLDFEFIDARRLYLANRGIWDSIASAGPQVSFAHSADDVDGYVAAAARFLREAMD